MIDIGLTKIALIGVVALVVIGPEKLPRVARMAGTLLGRAQRYLNQVKAEVGREMELDELRNMRNEMQQAASELHKDFSEAGNTIHTAVTDAAHAVRDDDWSPAPSLPSPAQLAEKAKNFRRKKMIRTAAVPAWYKQQNGRKSRVLSAAARVARYRPASGRDQSTPFFH